MSGALWALAAGAGFGLFQSLNRQAVRGMNVYVATFVQLVVSSVILILISMATDDVNLLFSVPPIILVHFAIAGFLHFLIGWTLLNASQKRIGASRTSPLIGTTPVFAAVIAAFTLNEIPTWLEVLGIGIIIAGAYLVSKESGGTPELRDGNGSLSAAWSASWLGLGAAFFWAVSPIFIRYGLEGLPSPLLGVTVGVTASALAYAVVLVWQRGRWLGESISSEAWTYKVIAGVLVGLSTWMRWVALDLAPVAVALALMMISTPLVILLAPLISGRHLERITSMLLTGTGLILTGTLLLLFS